MKQDDDAQIAEVLDRKPSPYRYLLKGGHGQLVGLIGPSAGSASALVQDYFELAHHAAARTVQQPRRDLALLPVLYLYRHAIELALKYSIALLNRAVEQHGSGNTESIPEHHKLGPILDAVLRLFPVARSYLNQVGHLEFISVQAVTFIRELHDLDQTGQRFRYVHTKIKEGQIGRQIENDVQIDIEALVAGMVHIEAELSWFMANVENGVDIVDEYLSDIGPL